LPSRGIVGYMLGPLVPEKQRALFDHAVLAAGAKTRMPDARPHRARDIVASLRADESSAPDVFDAFWELDKLPIDEVRDALTAWVGPEPDRNRLDTATCLARGLPARPLRLRLLSVTKDADVLDLGSMAEEQLRLAGKSWDGVDLAPEERLDGELEGSFAGTLERRVLADADAPGDTPLFDVLLFAEDAGVVFAAGSTKIVALVAYRKVELRDRRTRVALEEAIATPGAASSAESSLAPAVTEEHDEPRIAAPVEERAIEVAKTVTKRAGAKRVVAKTTRVATKAAPAKKTAVKKTVVKKTAVKKTAAKKMAKKAVVKTAKEGVGRRRPR
jgi:hypothetical protein